VLIAEPPRFRSPTVAGSVHRLEHRAHAVRSARRRWLERVAVVLRGQTARSPCKRALNFPMYEAIVREALRSAPDLLVVPAGRLGHAGPATLTYTDARLIEAPPCPAPQALGRSCRGLSTKIHAPVESLGQLGSFTLIGGEVHDVTEVRGRLVGIDTETVIADKACDSAQLINFIRGGEAKASVRRARSDSASAAWTESATAIAI
jgi:hypothetical protein